MLLPKTQKSARCLSAMRAFTCETLARGARPNAFASRLRPNAKDGRSVASRIGPSEVKASFAETGRPGTRFSRGSGFGAADGGAGIEHSGAAPRRLGAMFCLALSRAKNSVMTPPGAASNGVMGALPGSVAAIQHNREFALCFQACQIFT